MTEISVKRNFSEPIMDLLTQSINLWLGNDLNSFNNEAFEPIVCWEKALQEANKDEMQDLCDEISEIYVNLEMFIVKSSIYNALLSAEYSWYWWGFKKSNARHKRMQELKKQAKKSGLIFNLIEWNELVNTIVNTFFKESVSLLMIKVVASDYYAAQNLFDENNSLFFQSADEIEAFIRVFNLNWYFMSRTGEEEEALYGSLKNYELIYKKFYVLANLIEHLLENTMSKYEAEYSMNRLMNGIYAVQDDTLTVKLRSEKSMINKSGISYGFKRVNSLLSDEIKTQRHIKFDIYNSVSKKIEAFEEEAQEVTQKYQNEINGLTKKSNSILMIFKSKEKQEIVKKIADLEKEKAQSLEEIEKKVADLEIEREEAKEIYEEFRKAFNNPLSEHINWDILKEHLTNLDHLPTATYTSKEDLIEEL